MFLDPLQSSEPIIKLDPHGLCLAWPLMNFYTFQPIYDTFKSNVKWWQSEKFDFNINFTMKPETAKILQTTIWYWTPIIDLLPTNGPILKITDLGH